MNGATYTRFELLRTFRNRKFFFFSLGFPRITPLRPFVYFRAKVATGYLTAASRSCSCTPPASRWGSGCRSRAGSR